MIIFSGVILMLGSFGSQAAETTKDDYFLFQSVTLSDINNKITGFSTSGISSVLKTVNAKQVDYELWTQGSANGTQEKKVYGPVQFNRNPKNEEISFKTAGLGLVEEVVNQTIKQVKQNPRKEGAWNQELTLNLLETYLPQKLIFHFSVQKIGLKKGVQALFVQTYSDVFKISILPKEVYVDNGYFIGIYKGAYIYSPEEHRLYQMTSEFDAKKGNETIQIQDAAFLAGPDGKPAYPLIDMRETLGIKKQDKSETLVSMPEWAMQAIKVQQAVSISAVTTAERASNPGILPIISQIVELDGFAGILGLPSSSSLIEAYGEAQAGQAGEIAGRFFSTVGSEAIGASGILPETLLATSVPLIPALATAYSVYTMYTIAADMTALAFAADIGKLTPFEWPKCEPMQCLAEADKAFDLNEPYEPPADPGAIPEPGKSSGIGKAGLWIGAGAAIAAGAALGLKGAGGSGDDSDDGVSDECSEAYDYVEQTCCTSSGGIQTVAIPVKKSCGCPPGTTDVGDDNVTAGGPYDLCDCNCN